MNTNTRKTNIFVTIGAIALLAHAVGFLLPWCNMNGVKVQEGLAFIAGGSWIAIALCLGFELYFAFVRWQSAKLIIACRVLSVLASVAALMTELFIISGIKISMSSYGAGIYICVLTLAVNILCCVAVCVLSVKEIVTCNN